MERLTYGGVEGGGTKFVCAVGTGPADVETATIRTTTPDETLARAAEFFETEGARHGGVAAVGVACFGPIDPDPASPSYGVMQKTPKPGWTG